MQKLLTKILIISALVFINQSCKKKNKLDPFGSGVNSCPLLAVTDENGNTIRDFEYVGDQLIRIYSKDDPASTMSFRYDENGRVKTMEVENEEDLESYLVKYTYDKDNRISETMGNVAGLDFMKNTFTYSDNKITQVNTEINLFGQSISGFTRIEYVNGNVSSVFTSIDGEPEKLAYKGEQYDSKPQFNPPIYKIAAMGFVGVANNFFSYFGKNNLVSGKVYNEDGIIDHTTQIVYDYNKQELPKTSESIVTKGSDIKRSLRKYEFNCK